VIVGLVHQDVGHLGIFVSGKVARKEHSQIVSVLESIEQLPPGLYAMEIKDRKGPAGGVEYEVTFSERRLEEVVERLNRFNRADEKAFEAVAAISEFNQKAYELFVQPWIQAWSSEPLARTLRALHPLRFQRWAVSDSYNPWLWWLGPVAHAIRAQRSGSASEEIAGAVTQRMMDANPWATMWRLNPWSWWLGRAAEATKTPRHAVHATDPLRELERATSDLVSAWLDYCRDLRDATSEALFFQVYGNIFSVYLADRTEADASGVRASAAPRDLPFVRETLASIGDGGYPEAVARISFLLARKGEPLPLTRLALRKQLTTELRELLPEMPLDQWRRMRGEQEIVVRYEPDRAVETLPMLLHSDTERTRLLTLLHRVATDDRIQEQKPTDEQLAMLSRIRRVLEPEGAGASHATSHAIGGPRP